MRMILATVWHLFGWWLPLCLLLLILGLLELRQDERTRDPYDDINERSSL